MAAALALAVSEAAGQNQAPYRSPFPLSYSGTGANGSGALRGGHPAIGHLGIPAGVKSIVFGTAAGRLFAVRGDTGAVLAGFPVTLPSEIVSSPAVGDLDNDGVPDIVVGFGSQFANGLGGVRALRRDGTQLWQRITGGGDGIEDAVVSAPALGDVDGDGQVDVVFTSFDQNVYLVNAATGANKPGWPRPLCDTIWSSPALFDLDGDSRLDIIVGVDAHMDAACNTPNGGCLHALRYDGTELPGFPICIDQVISSSPAVGDIDGDGRPEIVVGTGGFWPNAAHVVYAFRCNGSLLPGWPVAVDGEVATAPALADLDSDGVPDVVVTDHYRIGTPSPPPQAVYAFKGNGTRLFRTVPKDFFGNTLSAGDPVVADVLGDANSEILVPTNGEVCVLSNTGVQLTDSNGFTPPNPVSFLTEGSLPAVSATDFDADGTVEVVAVSGAPFPASTNSKVFVWNPKSNAVPAPWGVFRQNERRTGVLPGTPGCLTVPPVPISFYTLTPCRVADTRNAAGPYGGPALSAQSARVFTLAGQCGIPLDALAVSTNITITNPTASGDLRVYPAGSAAPLASTINFRPGQVRANNAVVGLGTGGLVILNDQPAGTVHFILDVNGYFK